MRHEADYLADIIDYADEIASVLTGVDLTEFIANDCFGVRSLTS
jgi:uncharacterized protein with HEPN domain